MKILLDECVPEDFRHCLSEHTVHTARWAGLKGLTNGKLLLAAEAAQYQILLTVDQGIAHQQRLAGRTLAVLVVISRTNQLEDLLAFVPQILAAIERIGEGEVHTVR